MPGPAPAVIDAEIESRILRAVRAGKKQSAAAKEAGISHKTLNRAIVRGRREPDSPYGAFAKAYADAEEAWRQTKREARNAKKLLIGSLA